MALTKSAICNMALAHCGVNSSISDVDTEDSNEAVQCRLFYEHCRDLLLESQEWNFAKRQYTLVSLGTPPDEWNYRYAFPNDFKRVNKIVNPYERTPGKNDRIPFEIVDKEDAPGKAILCDQEDAIMEGNYAVTNEARFDSHFSQALAVLLASHIAMPLRVDANITANLIRMASGWINAAGSQNFSQRQPDQPADSEFVSMRG